MPQDTLTTAHGVHLRGKRLSSAQGPGGRLMGLRGSVALTLTLSPGTLQSAGSGNLRYLLRGSADRQSLGLRSDSAYEATLPRDDPAHVGVPGGCRLGRTVGWLLQSEPVGGQGEACGGGACGAEKWVLRRSAGARGGESARLAALWPRPGPGGKAGTAWVLPHWRWAEPGARKRG